MQSLIQKPSQSIPHHLKHAEKQQKRAGGLPSTPTGRKKTPKVNIKSSRTYTKNSFLKNFTKSDDPEITLYASDLSGKDGMSTSSEAEDGITEVKI